MEKSEKLLENLRQQYDGTPYLNFSLEKSPQEKLDWFFKHYVVTPYYLKSQKVVSTEGKVILDAGCGSGYKSLMLARANPGAKIIGVDFSQESIHLAEKRLRHHGFSKAEFHVLAIEDLANLAQKFDYINCDEVLYFFPDPVSGLKTMKSVLKPDGVIRANLHSSIQRAAYFRAQTLFSKMGLMDEAPKHTEIELVRTTMNALKDNVQLKRSTWDASFDTSPKSVLMNHLIVGDQGFTVPEMFSILDTAGLEFMRMVDWRTWQLETLFQDPDDLPLFLDLSLPSLSQTDALELFELLQPTHYLLDFWCGHPGQFPSLCSISEWSWAEWQQVQVHLHPYLQTSEIEAAFISSATRLNMLVLNQYLPDDQEPVVIDSTVAAALLPLLSGPQSLVSLMRRWQQLRPLHPQTLEPAMPDDIFALLRQTLVRLEQVGVVMLER